jgi:succinoglycan biosynthesis transport protein ExoP
VQFSDFPRILRRNVLILIGLSVLAAGAGAGYSAIQTPLYQSTASVFVTTQSANTVSELSQGSTYTQQVVQSYADVVTKAIVLAPVIEELGLQMTPAALAGKLSASAPLNTVLLEISAVDPSPALAAKIANSVTRSLVAVVPELSPTTAGTAPQVKITVLQPAVPSTSPVVPRTAVNIALGLLVGLALALAIAVAREVLDTRIRTLEDIRLVTELPVLGGITYDRDSKTNPLVVQHDPRGPRAESFRSLRTNLQFLDGGRGVRSVVMTSSVENEGKTTSAANLGIAMAEAGLSTVIVEADLRKPRLSTALDLEGAVGLTDVLIGRFELDEVLQEWGAHGMAVLPAGPIPPNPSELLQSEAMADLVSKLLDRFEVVLFDAPPLLPVSDAAVLSRLTDGAIVVAAARRTNSTMLKAAIDVVDAVDARVLGILVTMLPAKGPDAAGFGGYGHSYHYAEATAKKPKIGRAARIKARAGGALRISGS